MSSADYGYNLISFKLCPYVQRAVIMLEERQVPYTLDHIDIKNKPQWFLELSPLGKVPVLRVTRPGGDEAVIFESAVICELIEETAPGERMHPEDPLRRAHNRAWVETVSEVLRRMQRLIGADSEDAAREAATAVGTLLRRLHGEIQGPLFNGERFSLVDAAAAPALQRLSWCEELAPSLDMFGQEPTRLHAWREALLARPAVQRSAVPELRELFFAHLRARSAWFAAGPG